MNFTAASLDFLFENKLKDSKQWYTEHKEDHKRLVIEPFRETVEKITPYIEKIDPTLSCNPKRHSRIYRDTRFTKDKSTFRDNIWYCFMHGKELYEGYPCFFFDISPRGLEYGVGYYKADTKSMEAIRELVKRHDKSFLKARKVLESHDELEFYCNPYKKNHFPDAPVKDQPYLNIRDFCAIAHSKDFDLIFSDSLADELGKRFTEMKPIYDFLMKAESMVDRT